MTHYHFHYDLKNYLDFTHLLTPDGSPAHIETGVKRTRCLAFTLIYYSPVLKSVTKDVVNRHIVKFQYF